MIDACVHQQMCIRDRINAATTWKAFGQAEKALPLYEKAWRAYSGTLDPADYRFAGLSNNMALSYADLGEYAQAGTYYEKAIGIMKKLPQGSMAVSYTHLASIIFDFSISYN